MDYDSLAVWQVGIVRTVRERERTSPLHCSYSVAGDDTSSQILCMVAVGIIPICSVMYIPFRCGGCVQGRHLDLMPLGGMVTLRRHHPLLKEA